ncbi:hypothetical protein AN958_10969 [Leucoagaricus sp. SymC.cos]|nr:hypothetical protein AN958_10969 [Leucoagaricus sp. SymC.cos]
MKYREWTVEDWKRIIWSDKTKINRIGSDGRQWVKPPGNMINSEDSNPLDFSGSGSRSRNSTAPFHTRPPPSSEHLRTGGPTELSDSDFRAWVKEKLSEHDRRVEALEKDNAYLRSRVEELLKDNKGLVERNKELEAELERAEERVQHAEERIQHAEERAQRAEERARSAAALNELYRTFIVQKAALDALQESERRRKVDEMVDWLRGIFTTSRTKSLS